MSQISPLSRWPFTLVDRKGFRITNSLVIWLLGVFGGLLVLAPVILPPPLGLLVTPGIIAGVAVLIWPASLALGLVWSVPVQDVFQIPVGYIGVTFTQVMLAVATVVFPIILFVRGQPCATPDQRWRWRKHVYFPGIAIATTIFLLVQVASLTVAEDILLGVASIYRWAAALLAFLVVVHFVNSRRVVLFLAFGLVFAAFGEVAFGALQSLFGIAPPSFAVAAGIYRAYGTFGQPNPYAGYLEMVGLWLAALSLWAVSLLWRLMKRYRFARIAGVERSRWSRRWVLWILFWAVTTLFGAGVAFLGILLSFSRGAWIGVLAGLSVLIAFAPRYVRIFLLALGLLGGMFLLSGGWASIPSPLRERFVQTVSQMRPFDVRDVQLTDANWAVVERMAHWQTAWEMFLDHPWTGVGAGNYGVAFPLYSPHPLFRVARGHAHNYYLHVLAELGLPGLVAYLAVVGLGLVVGLQALRRARGAFERALGIGSLAVTVAILVHNLVENLHALHLSVQLFAIWALAWRTRLPWQGEVSE